MIFINTILILINYRLLIYLFIIYIVSFYLKNKKSLKVRFYWFYLTLHRHSITKKKFENYINPESTRESPNIMKKGDNQKKKNQQHFY